MTYRDTARRLALAEQSTRYGAAPTPHALAADKLPMSEWAEARRHDMTPQTIAHNHAAHVSDTAAELRDILDAYDEGPADPLALAEELQDAARALLAAIGEATPNPEQSTNATPKESEPVTTALFICSPVAGDDAPEHRYTGQRVEVVRPLDPNNPADSYDEEVGPMFRVRTANGHEFDAFGDELSEREAAA